MLRSTPERCTYAPPMPLAPTMPMHVRGPPAQRLLAFSSLRQIACFLPLRPSWFLGIISITCSCLSSYVVLYETPPFDLYCFISPSFPPGWRRLSGISLWHIVRPILLNSSFSLTFYHPNSSTYLLSICLLPLTTPHLLVTSQPLYPTLFKVNSHNFIYTFILLWGKKEEKKTSYSPSLTCPSVVRHTGSQHSLTAPFSNHSFRAPARYLLTTTPFPFLLHNSPYPILYCPLTTPPAAHSFALFGVLPLRRAFACHHFEPLLE